MSAFFVGQRVRLVAIRRATNQMWRAGEEGRVAEKGPSWLSVPSDWMIVLDNGVHGYVLEDQIEPILPSGHQPAELTVEELLPFLKTREVA
jgi:hypothetical protein